MRTITNKDYTIDENGCWIWNKAIQHGYGVVKVNGKMRKAHRVHWEQEKEKLPKEIQLDHVKEKCKSKACINLNHLEPVTARVNTLRSNAASAINAIKTHCLNGHEFNSVNTGYDCHRKRKCKPCARERYLKLDGLGRKRNKSINFDPNFKKSIGAE